MFPPPTRPELFAQSVHDRPDLPRLVPRSVERELAQLAAISARRASGRAHPRRSLLRFLVRRRARRCAASGSTITIRPATPRDRAQLQRIAALDERPLPPGDALVAEVDERIVASVSLETGEPVADPFRARGDVVLLLELRAAQLAA